MYEQLPCTTLFVYYLYTTIEKGCEWGDISNKIINQVVYAQNVKKKKKKFRLFLAKNCWLSCLLRISRLNLPNNRRSCIFGFLGRKQIYAKLTTTVVINPTTSPNLCPLIKYWSNKVLFHCTFHLDLVFYIYVHF